MAKTKKHKKSKKLKNYDILRIVGQPTMYAGSIGYVLTGSQIARCFGAGGAVATGAWVLFDIHRFVNARNGGKKKKYKKNHK